MREQWYVWVVVVWIRHPNWDHPVLAMRGIFTSRRAALEAAQPGDFLACYPVDEELTTSDRLWSGEEVT